MLSSISFLFSVTIFTLGSFPGVKWPGRGADHPPPSKCQGHERVRLYLYSPSGLQWPVMGRTFTSIILTINDIHQQIHIRRLQTVHRFQKFLPAKSEVPMLSKHTIIILNNVRRPVFNIFKLPKHTSFGFTIEQPPSHM